MSKAKKITEYKEFIAYYGKQAAYWEQLLKELDMADTNQLPPHTITIRDHPEPHIMQWSDLELAAVKRYAEQYALQARSTQAVPMTDEEAKELIKKSDLLDMFLHIGWYSAPRKNFDTHALALIRAVESRYAVILTQQPDNAACKSVQKRLEAQQPATSEPVKLHKECATMPNYERCNECQQSTPEPAKRAER